MLTPVLEREVARRDGAVELAKLDVDANPGTANSYRIQGIPAVKAFRDGRVVAEFVGAQPATAVSRFLDSLVPSQAELLARNGDEDSLRQALKLEPGRADAALPLARILHRRAELDEALDVLGDVRGSFAADGLAARIRLEKAGPDGLVPAFGALDDGLRTRNRASKLCFAFVAASSISGKSKPRPLNVTSCTASRHFSR